MEIEQFRPIAEAILFACGTPVEADKIADALEIDKKECNQWLEKLMEDYNTESHGTKIVKLNESFQMCSREQYAGYIIKVLDMRKNTPLSQAAMEVLAIVAYNEPVTKSFIEQVRGVDCSGVIASLSAKRLIEERGRLELPGRPLLYGITENFLRCFGISSTLELPPLQDKNDLQEAQDEAENTAENDDENGEEIEISDDMKFESSTDYDN